MSSSGYQKAGFLVVLAVLSAYFCNSIAGLVNPAIASLAAAYPDASLNTIMLVSTIPMLFAIPTNFLSGAVVKKIGVKNTLIGGLIIFIVSSVVPFTMRTSFTPILVTRAINGLGYGLLSPITPMLVNAYIEPERRSSILGFGQSVTQAFGIFLSAVVGIVAAGTVYNIWLLNLVMCIPLVLGLMLPKPPQWEEAAVQEGAAEAASAEQAPAQKEKIPAAGWVIIFLGFLWFVFSYPAFLYLSPLILGKGMGDASMAGFVQTMFNVGGVIAGLIFAKVYGAARKYTICVGLIMLVINYALFAFTSSAPLYYAANIIGGIGYSVVYVGFITALSINCAPTVFPTAMGFMSALMNCGAFVSSYVISFIAGIAGMSASLTFPFVLCAAVFVVFTIVLIIRPLKM